MRLWSVHLSQLSMWIEVIIRMISRNQRAVDEATNWLKRIVVAWIVLNSLGFIVAYLQPLITGGTYTGAVLCYTSPLAFSMGDSKTTSQVFRSWCRMLGSQLLLLVLNVWFLRAFSTSVGQFIINNGALTNGKGSIFVFFLHSCIFKNGSKV